MRSPADSIQYIYAILFGRPIFEKLNRFILCLGLRGLGYLNYWDLDVSGERGFIRKIERRRLKNRRAVIFDVGAHDGEYARMCADIYRQEGSEFAIHCFEPSRDSFNRLRENTSDRKEIVISNSALASVSGAAQLFDIGLEGTEHASLSKKAVQKISQQEPVKQLVDVQTGDEYCKENGIAYIDVLKIDVEGFELDVLKGFSRMLQSRSIGAIQFEFNITSLQEGVRVEDFQELLRGYVLYRLLPGGKVLKDKDRGFCIYTYQNIVCLPYEKAIL